MPTLAEGEARTIVVNPSGPPSNTLTAVLPPGVTISLESVLAAIDASGAGDTTALLEIADSSGAVIARKAQGQAVTGGVVGSATWALRLGDEASGAATTATKYGIYTGHISVPAGGVVSFNWAYSSGDALLDLSLPAAPSFLADGTYIVNVYVELSGGAATAGYLINLNVVAFTTAGIVAFSGSTVFPLGGVTAVRMSACAPLLVTAGDGMQAQMNNGQPVTALPFDMIAYVAKLS